MADFWIKIEKGTPDKPEILEMSAILNIPDPDTIMGKLIRVWSWFDSNSANGHAPSVTNVLLDRVTGVTGFTDAMIKVGWLIKTDSGFYVSNFDRHLGETAKKRASDAERKRKSRLKSQESHGDSVTINGTESGLDKSRVDNNKKKNNKKEIVDFSCFEMTDEQISELKRIRKKNKGGSITQRVANALAVEFNKARELGHTVDDLLTEWEVRGWKSLKSEWIKTDGGYSNEKNTKSLSGCELIRESERVATEWLKSQALEDEPHEENDSALDGTFEHVRQSSE